MPSMKGNGPCKKGKINAWSAERRGIAMSLRLKGMVYKQIAETMQKMRIDNPEKYSQCIPPSYDSARAGKDVNQELQRMMDENLETAAKIKVIEEQRLDRMLTVCEQELGRQGSDKLACVNTAIRISESRRRLLGTDSPVKTEIAGPGQGPVQLSRPLDLSAVPTEELEAVMVALRKARVVDDK